MPFADVCKCFTGYYGIDCSQFITQSPEVYSLSRDTYVISASQVNTDVIQDIIVYGSGFINSDDLSCHLHHLKVGVF